ncbi:hypothetical protein [Candidatus Borrarchaeum sp.]|uniref:hypothetical protein n=1 Tax=Candidatus Borrarchaeum sp. TaxID=2846742 RepID=UPI00257F7BCF|nr:hypothetical protein [Candidatus Borrarchaeum sp.]
MTISTLSGELKNTPRDASLVPCSVNGGLNREETLSDHRIVLTDNLGEENLLPWCWERRDLRVPVIKTHLWIPTPVLAERVECPIHSPNKLGGLLGRK